MVIVSSAYFLNLEKIIEMEIMPAGLFVPKSQKEKKKHIFSGADSCLLSGQKAASNFQLYVPHRDNVFKLHRIKRVKIVSQLISTTTRFLV